MCTCRCEARLRFETNSGWERGERQKVESFLLFFVVSTSYIGARSAEAAAVQRGPRDTKQKRS